MVDHKAIESVPGTLCQIHGLLREREISSVTRKYLDLIRIGGLELFERLLAPCRNNDSALLLLDEEFSDGQADPPARISPCHGYRQAAGGTRTGMRQ